MLPKHSQALPKFETKLAYQNIQ
ncbi:hypothetical protein MPLA_320046 [Mesorhizobium sp. ORS 3359]|nr:hypothetical protein MPLA_320046 [Mesorhizobium sp. ORS 3359]